MNIILKTIIMVWLAFCAIFIWVTLAICGFIFAFTEFQFIYSVTPFIGLTIVIGIIRYMVRVYNSDPMAYIDSKLR